MASTARAQIDAASPARLYCTLVGAGLVIAGVVGFFYSSGFETGVTGVTKDTDELLGLFAVNGWDNLLHLALGALALAVAGSPAGARTYCLAAGLGFVALAIWGLIDEDGIILGLLPLNNEDNLVYLLVGLVGLAAGAATARSAPPQRPAR